MSYIKDINSQHCVALSPASEDPLSETPAEDLRKGRNHSGFKTQQRSVADLGDKGRAPLAQSFFIFMQFFEKKSSNNRMVPPVGLVPPEEILDPPLQMSPEVANKVASDLT